MNRLIIILCALLSFAEAWGQSSEERNRTFSPDSSMVAYTKGNDLWIRNLEDSVEFRLTSDGSEDILNGYASWVYYEEIFGRASNYRAFWWSPDSKKLAFYRFDDSEVPCFSISSPFGQSGALFTTHYPKAGQTNPSVSIGIVDVESKTTIWADFDYTLDQYFGTPFWSKDADELFVPRQPRRQNLLELFAVNASKGSSRLVYREESETWIDWIEDMLFTEQGFYMARNFETEWEQIYFLDYKGKLKCLSEGKNWDIRLRKADEQGNIWFTAKRDSPLHSSLYLLKADGSIVALTDPDYSVTRLSFSEADNSFTATVSNARSPFREVQGNIYGRDCEQFSTDLAATPATLPDFSAIYPLDAGILNIIDTLDRPYPIPVKIENEGFELYALISFPKGFDVAKTYPVVVQVYGGPGTPYVRDIWVNRDASDEWCYRNGIIYMVCDPRSAGENGRRGTDEAFGLMTVTETEDYVAWAKWLTERPYVNAERIGVKGFSFGGTMTAMLVLRCPEYFRCGIAGGGVYDWTLYDSHYTERFMDTPEANPQGYELASVIAWVPKVFASDEENKKTPLPGALRLTHGTKDDNVHLQNTLLLMDALQKEGYPFEVMLYPDGMHGYRGYQSAYEHKMEAEFWTRWLLE